MQAFRRHMPVTALEQHARQFHPLAGGPQASLAQARGGLGAGVPGFAQCFGHGPFSSYRAGSPML